MCSVDYSKQSALMFSFHHVFWSSYLDIGCLWRKLLSFVVTLVITAPLTAIIFLHIDPCPLCVCVSDLISAGPLASDFTVQLLLLHFHPHCRSHVLTTPISYFIHSMPLRVMPSCLRPANVLLLLRVHQ